MKTGELGYENAYHLHCAITLNSGRSITLTSLHQEMTYAGLLIGTPSRASNDMRLRDDACETGTGGVRAVVLSPPRRDYRRTPGDMDRFKQRSPGRAPEWLPSVRCVGSFSSTVTARGPDKHLSVLTVIWYQDEYLRLALTVGLLAAALGMLGWAGYITSKGAAWGVNGDVLVSGERSIRSLDRR